METAPHHISGRETIRLAATSLFAEKGFAATSTREICERAGVTKPVLYYHFGSKEQLYKELILDAYHEYVKELDRAAAKHGGALQRFEAIINMEFAFCRRYPELMRLAFRMVFAPESESPVVDYVAMAELAERVLARIAEEGIKQGIFGGNPVEIAYGIAGVVRYYLMSYLVTGQPTLDQKLASRVAHLVTAGCLVYTDR